MKHRNGFTLVEIVIGICIVVILGATVRVVLSSDADKPPEASAVGDELPGRVKIVCIDGHEYLYAETRTHARAVMAPRFNDEGKPRKCQVERPGSE
jgi:prepilin-type N-terminal cleavage/methylation domain-containing protein